MPAVDIAGQWQAEFDTQVGVQKYRFDFQVKDGRSPRREPPKPAIRAQY
jgi:hypothetical protein